VEGTAGTHKETEVEPWSWKTAREAVRRQATVAQLAVGIGSGAVSGEQTEIARFEYAAAA